MQALVRCLLEWALGKELTEDTLGSTYDACPELAWLARCLLSAPLPPDWSVAVSPDAEAGVIYRNEHTGERSSEPPLLRVFAKLARLMIYALHDPVGAFAAAQRMRRRREVALHEAHCVHEVWAGPYRDVQSGSEYYHNPTTGRSTWESPASAQLYVAWVADQLLRHTSIFPTESAEDAGKLQMLDWQDPGAPLPPQHLSTVAENSSASMHDELARVEEKIVASSQATPSTILPPASTTSSVLGFGTSEKQTDATMTALPDLHTSIKRSSSDCTACLSVEDGEHSRQEKAPGLKSAFSTQGYDMMKQSSDERYDTEQNVLTVSKSWWWGCSPISYGGSEESDEAYRRGVIEGRRLLDRVGATFQRELAKPPPTGSHVAQRSLEEKK